MVMNRTEHERSWRMLTNAELVQFLEEERKAEENRLKMIADQIKKGCDKCSQWNEYWGCFKCED